MLLRMMIFLFGEEDEREREEEELATDAGWRGLGSNNSIIGSTEPAYQRMVPARSQDSQGLARLSQSL